MVVVYRKVYSKVIFDSYPIPTIEQFWGCGSVISVTSLFSVLKNSPFASKSSGDCLLQAICSFFNLISCPWGLVWHAGS